MKQETASGYTECQRYYCFIQEIFAELLLRNIYEGVNKTTIEDIVDFFKNSHKKNEVMAAIELLLKEKILLKDEKEILVPDTLFNIGQNVPTPFNSYLKKRNLDKEGRLYP